MRAKPGKYEWLALGVLALVSLIGCVPATHTTLRGDVNGDGVVDGADLDAMVALFGVTADDPRYVPAADLDGDGVIGLPDLQALAQILGSSSG